MPMGVESLVLSAQTGVTDASGNVSFTFSTDMFDGKPAISLALEAANGALMEARLTAATEAGCTVNVRKSSAVTVLGISVLGAALPAPGVIVHIVAVQPEDYI